MKHTCKYCKSEFEGRPNAATCSPNCRKAFSAVVKYWEIWGITKPIDSDIKPVKQGEPNKQAAPIIKPKSPHPAHVTHRPKPEQETPSEQWARVQAYKKRHKFD